MDFIAVGKCNERDSTHDCWKQSGFAKYSHCEQHVSVEICKITQRKSFCGIGQERFKH